MVQRGINQTIKTKGEMEEAGEALIIYITTQDKNQRKWLTGMESTLHDAFIKSRFDHF